MSIDDQQYSLHAMPFCDILNEQTSFFISKSFVNLPSKLAVSWTKQRT